VARQLEPVLQGLPQHWRCQWDGVAQLPGITPQLTMLSVNLFAADIRVLLDPLAVRLRREKVSTLPNKYETDSDRLKLEQITNFKHWNLFVI
jgi:hypothetical protein